MASIMQGTTPSLKIRIDTSDFLVTEATAVELYVRNAGETRTYTLDDLTVDASENAFVKQFTEEETAAFMPRKAVIVQARVWFADGNIVGINKVYINVADMMEVGDDG